MTDKPLIFIDSNILIYATFEDSPQFNKARIIRDKAVEGKIKACISTQVITEYYSTITDSRKFLKPLSPFQAQKEITNYLSSNLLLFPIKKSTLTTTIQLAAKYMIKRQKLYDTQIVATMIENKVNNLYTFNDKDFIIYSEIKLKQF